MLVSLADHEEEIKEIFKMINDIGSGALDWSSKGGKNAVFAAQ